MARARNTALLRRLQDRPHAPHLPQLECRPTAAATTDDPAVVDNLPPAIPVTGPELDVIETYLGHLIDRLLMDAASDKSAMPSTSKPGVPIWAPVLDRN